MSYIYIYIYIYDISSLRVNMLSPVSSDLCATLCEKIIIEGLDTHCIVYSEVQVIMPVILIYLKLKPVRTI